MRKIRNESLTDWITHHREYDWNRARRWTQRNHDRTAIYHNDVRCQPDYFRHILIDRLRIGRGKPIIDLYIAPFNPSQITHTQSECLDAVYRFGVFFGEAKQHADRSHPVGALRPRRKRPRCRRASDKRDERAPPHVRSHALETASYPLKPLPNSG
jgi:hypothetical protein